jgi:hypothetical protein
MNRRERERGLLAHFFSINRARYDKIEKIRDKGSLRAQRGLNSLEYYNV